MLLSLNWLRDYLAKMDVKINAQDLAHDLTMIGLPVSSVRSPHSSVDNVVVGRIEKIEKHPNADKLSVTQVMVENKADSLPLQIVCGASNITEGDLVPVALIGAVLPGDFRIKKTVIRGVESSGMICSEKELGLSEESKGILQLPKHSSVGEPLSKLLGQNQDTILEFELTPNRADCLSVIGLAREIAPILRTKYREPKPARFRVTPHRTSSIVTIEVEDPKVCSRYVARVIDNLRVTDSPDWIKQRLLSVGIRPINNIVDITNFVMLEYGQPLHAFDLRRIESGKVKITSCKEDNHDFELLTGEVIQLQQGDILIQDGDKPIALAGIMGGANTQILPDTTSILLESAAFPRELIRKTSKRLGLLTESARRFEKGVDLDCVAKASERAASLLRECFDANVYHPPIDTNEAQVKERLISIDMREVRKVTGLTQLSLDSTSDALESIGISCHKRSLNILSIRVPSFRLDLLESVDIIEEIARLIGYDTIPCNYPISSACYDARFDESVYELEKRTKNFFMYSGLRETIHYSFTSVDWLEQFGIDTTSLVHLQNPLNEDFKVLRPMLLPSLIQTYLYNKNRKTTQQRFFETARTYQADDREESKVKETLCVAGLLSGFTQVPDWKKSSTELDFYFAKGLVEQLVKHISTIKLTYEPLSNHRMFHPAKSAVLKLGLREVGMVGEIHPYIKKQVLETQENIVLFELNLEALKKFERRSTSFKTPSKFPSVEFDIAVVADKAITAQSLTETIKNAGGALLSEIRVFDIYEGDAIPLGKRSLAFHVSLSAPDKTLQDEETHQIRERIIHSLSDRHGAKLRA